MCCLKYENDVYMELRKGLPDYGEKVKTKDGMGKVVDTNILESKVKVRLYTNEKDDDGEQKLGTDIYTYKKMKLRDWDSTRNIIIVIRIPTIFWKKSMRSISTS